jgi:hypothetical protein
MLFNLDLDSRLAISGWLICDNPGDLPVFRFSVPGREDHVFKANVFRRDLYDLGLHSTGMAGFLIDEQMIPGLSEINNFLLREATTGLPLYSRYDAETHIERKLLMIDTGALPQIRAVQRIVDRFTMRYPMIDRYSLETVSSILGRPFFPSVVATGNVNWMRIAGIVEASNFSTMTLLRDPFEEMAEKFIFLKRLAGQPSNALAAPILEKYEILLASIQDMDLQNSKSILTVMRSLNRDQRRLLRSPMTYAFGAAPDEELQRRNVSIALDNLARFTLVGVRSRFREFAMVADSLIGGAVFGDMELQNLPHTETLAAILSEIGIAGDLLDEDIALYLFAKEGVETALESSLSNGSKRIAATAEGK